MPDQPTSGDAARMDRASEIFFEVRPLGLAEREEAVERLCAGDAKLKDLVLLLLRGDQAPLPVESMADDIRAAQDVATQGHAAATVIGAQEARGSRIGRYRLLERIGEGGFGVVFAAEQTEPVKRRVALKVIKLGMDTRQVVARFEAERQALAMMDHPNIAKVFDAGATETGRPYFVMELVKGLPITEYCDTRKLSIPARLELFALVCDALQHAHQKGVIHRDIKPSNVLVTEMGEKVIPKVIDFGIAKATNAELTDKTIFTEMRQMIGTPEYMSPEQAGVSGLDIDTRTDVYSLGVLLYELLSGTTPFDSKRLRSAAYGEVQRIIREEDPPRPSTKLTTLETIATVAQVRGIEPSRLGSALKGELDWVVMKCLEKDRGRRYDSAGALMRDVRRFISGEAVQAVPPSAAYRFKKMVRRNKGPVVAGTLLAMALIAGLVGTSLGFFNAEQQRKVAVLQKDRATSEKERADENASKALAAESIATRQAYSANMLSACAAMETNQFGTAKAFLEAAPEGLRGWEWRTLWSRLDTSVREIACPMPNWRPDEAPQGANALLAHPDGRSFFTVRRDEADAAQQWDLATGRLLARFAHPAPGPPSILPRANFSLSADGERLLACPVGQGEPCSIAIWDLRTGERVARTNVPAAGEGTAILALSPDGTRLVRGRSTMLAMQDIATGKVLATRQIKQLGGTRTFNADGTLYARSDPRGDIELLDGDTLAPITTLVGHTNDIHDLDFSRDGRWLASAAIDGKAIVWDLQAKPPTSVAFEHPGKVGGISLSPDASLVATSCIDSTIRVWDARTGELRASYTRGGLLYGAVMFLPDGHTVAGRERDGTVRFWDVSAENTVNLRGHKGDLNQAFFAEKAGLIVSAGWDGWKGSTGCIRLWDAQTGDEVGAIGEPGEHAYVLRVSPDGAHATACITWTESPWTPKSKVIHARVELINLVTGVRTRVGEERVLHPSRYSNVPVAFDPTSRQLAVKDAGRLDILDVASGAVRRSRADTPGVDEWGDVLWSPDGRVLASARKTRTGNAGNVNIVWEMIDAASLASLREFETIEPVSWTFTPDSTSLCFGYPDGVVRRFSVSSGKVDMTFQAHDLQVRSLAFNRDGSRLATAGGDDGDVIVWNTTTSPTFDRVARFHDDGWAGSVAWDATGERLMGTFGRTIRVWDSTSLRERVAAREARKAALTQLEPVVGRMFDELNDAERVDERINADASMNPLNRRTALQVVLAKSLAAQAAPREIQPGPVTAPK